MSTTEIDITLVAALDSNRVIGVDGDLPWHYPDDLAHFKKTTNGHPVIMGRVTYEGILTTLGEPLPNRQNLVLTSTPDDIDVTGGDVYPVTSVTDALSLAYHLASETDPVVDDVYVIGGASVYDQFIDTATRMVLTEIHDTHEGDTYFPEFDTDVWDEVDRDDRGNLSFVTYETTT